MNKVMLLGRFAKDPELRYTQSGTAVASFSLAVQRNYTNQNGEREADFINCTAWSKTAEFIANYFGKGKMIALEGRLQVRSYDDKDGQRKWTTEVVVEQVEFAGDKSEEGGGSSGNRGAANKGSRGYNNSSSNSSYDSPYPEQGLGLGQEIAFSDEDLPF